MGSIRNSVLAVTLLCTSLLIGCQHQQMAYSGSAFRDALLDMYTEQAIDNLIRAYTGQPYVQLQYRDLLVQDTDVLEGTAGFNYNLRRTVGISTVLERLAAIGGKANRSVQMTFHADPVTDAPTLYDEYLDFAFNPFLFCASCDKPTEPVHIMRKRDGIYYYVPCHAAADFQSLAMRTSVRRPAAVQDFAGLQCAVLGTEKLPGAEEGETGEYLVHFAKLVPNDDATLIVTVDNTRRVIRLLRVQASAPSPEFGGFPATQTLRYQGIDLDAEGLMKAIQGKQGLLISDTYIPPVPQKDNSEKRIQATLDRTNAILSLPR